jgi:hypothetical protein
MDLLHLFMFLMFIIGILLIITTFSTYSKLQDKCTSSDLRVKLRWAIGLGTTFITLAIGYGICVNKDGCNCYFGKRVNWKIYSLLAMLMTMGGGLLALTIGIKNDLKKDGCDLDIGATTTILMALSIAQIAIPAMYIIYITTNLSTQSKSDEEVEDADYASLTLEAESRTLAVNKRRLGRIKKSLATKEEQLSIVRDGIEKTLERKKAPDIKALSKENKLVKEINKAKSDIGLVSSTLSSSSGSSSGSSSNNSLDSSLDSYFNSQNELIP